MLKFFLFTLLLGSAIAASITKVIEDEDVQFIINGDESALPDDILKVNVNKIQGGNVVKTEQFFPDKQSVVELPALPVPEIIHPELPSLPIATPETLPGGDLAVAIPEVIDVPVVAMPLPSVDLTRPAPVPEDLSKIESLPIAVPEVIQVQPETRPAIDLPAVETPVQVPEEIAIAPAVVGEVYKDENVSVIVNAEDGIIAKVSSWMSMIINKFMGNSHESVKIV